MKRMEIPLTAITLIALSVLAPAKLGAFPDIRDNGSMIILRGIAADYAPRGLLDDDAAVAYAHSQGYLAEVLDVAADIPAQKSQIQMALERIRADGHVTAIYGFSGGGYNAPVIWANLNPQQRKRIQKIVVVGSPGVTPAAFPGSKEVVMQDDPPEGHMAGPKKLLEAAVR